MLIAFFFLDCYDWFRSNKNASRSRSLRPFNILAVSADISTFFYFKLYIFFWRCLIGDVGCLTLTYSLVKSLPFLFDLLFMRKDVTFDPFKPTSFL
jgi:hypothetical protein